MVLERESNYFWFIKSHSVTNPYSSPFFVRITQSLEDSRNGFTCIPGVLHGTMGGDSSINSEIFIFESPDLTCTCGERQVETP